MSKTKEPNSSLIQIVSRSNRFDGFMTVGITDDQIHVKHYNEIGVKWKFNNQYEEDGSLHIIKSSEEISIESSGELELLDDSVALIRFDFEEITPLGTRQVLGFHGDKTALMANSIDIDKVTCTDGLENLGSFGKQYDAQIGNVQLVEGRPGGGRSARFTDDSRLAIFAMGPLSGGQVVSVSLWFKTSHTQKDMVLVYSGQRWGPSKKKDQLAITLRNGIPTFYISRDQAYTVTGISSIADMNWHHLALTMPKQSCLSSEIQLYVDGYRASLETMMPSSPDNHVFFSTQGRMSFGGFGYSSKATRKIYKDMVPYMGELDEVTVWSRTLSIEDIIILASPNTASPEPISSPSSNPTKSPVIVCDENNCTDDETFTFPLNNGKVKNCAWFGKNNTVRRRAKYCVYEEIKSACQKSCSAISSPSPSPTISPKFLCDGNNCMDDETYTFLLNNGKVKNCAWFDKNNTVRRKSKYCVYEEIKSACQKSCSAIVSCQDDPEFTFSLRNGNTQNCSWFNKNEEKIVKRKYGYCYEDDRSTPTVLAGSCARSCGLCTSPEPISPSSPSPTKSPKFLCDGNNCMDDETYTFPLNNGKVKSCAWFGKNNTVRRKSKYCVYEEIKSACQKSCSAIVSCQDDPEFTFSLRNGNTKNCSWFYKNEEKIVKRKYGYCYEDDRSTPTVLAGSCARSCGLCTDD